MESLKSVTMVAGQDLSAHQYRFVTMASDGQIDFTGAGLAADGVLQDKPAAAGRACQVGIDGITRIVAGAAIAKGALVESDSAGRAVTRSSGVPLGRLQEVSALAAGDIVPLLLNQAPV